MQRSDTVYSTYDGQNWVFEGRLPERLYDHASAVLNDKIWIVGGKDSRNVYSSRLVDRKTVDTNKMAEYLTAPTRQKPEIRTAIIGGQAIPERQVSASDADFEGSGVVDFDDFFMFADVFGKKFGETGFDRKFDLDKDAYIGFTDFFAFADHFGKIINIDICATG